MTVYLLRMPFALSQLKTVLYGWPCLAFFLSGLTVKGDAPSGSKSNDNLIAVWPSALASSGPRALIAMRLNELECG